MSKVVIAVTVCQAHESARLSHMAGVHISNTTGEMALPCLLAPAAEDAADVQNGATAHATCPAYVHIQV